MLTVMDYLLLATGLTGGLTLVWMSRLVAGLFSRRPYYQPHYGPGTLDRVLREIASARREVVMFTDSLACPEIAQALVEASGRKAQVEVILGAVCETDPESSVGFLLERGLTPLVEDHADRLSGNVLLIDGRTLLLASGQFHTDEEQAVGCHVLVVKDQVELIGAYREQVLACRTRARPARRHLGPAGLAPQAPFSYMTPDYQPTPPPVSAPPAPYTAPMASEPEPAMDAAMEQEEAPHLPPPTPAVSSLLSRPLATFDPPAPEEDRDLRLPPRRPAPPALSDDEFEDHDTMPDRAPSGTPPVTLAAAELFARLRREVAARTEEPVESSPRTEE